MTSTVETIAGVFSHIMASILTSDSTNYRAQNEIDATTDPSKKGLRHNYGLLDGPLRLLIFKNINLFGSQEYDLFYNPQNNVLLLLLEI